MYEHGKDWNNYKLLYKSQNKESFKYVYYNGKKIKLYFYLYLIQKNDINV